jgi:hypothetical protein
VQVPVDVDHWTRPGKSSLTGAGKDIAAAPGVSRAAFSNLFPAVPRPLIVGGPAGGPLVSARSSDRSAPEMALAV